MRQQMQHRDVVAPLAGELRYHVLHLGVKRELPHLDRAQDEHVGERLRHREQAEDGILLHRPRLLRIRVPERLVEADLAAPRHDHGAAEIQVLGDIVLDDGFEIPQPLGIQSVSHRGVHDRPQSSSRRPARTKSILLIVE